MKYKADDIVAYFSEMYKLGKDYELPPTIVSQLNSLDRAERGELKSKLFTEARKLVQISDGNDGLKAVRWLENAFNLIEKNSFRMHEVLFSPGQDIPENIAFHINRAKESIDLCVFTISDEMLGKSLKAAHERGIKVRLITDGNKMRDTGSQVKDLARAGVQVKVDNSKYHMHNKFGLIDGKIAFTGSYNWTYTAKAYNQENLVITTNYTIVHAFIEEFEQLWEEMFTLKVKQKKDGRLTATVNVNGQQMSPYFANNGQRIPEDGDDGDILEDDEKPQLNPLTNTQDYKSRTDKRENYKAKRAAEKEKRKEFFREREKQKRRERDGRNDNQQ